MFDLTIMEAVLFVLVVGLYVAAGMIGVLQLLGERRTYMRVLLPLVAAAVVLEVIILVERGFRIGAIPLTGLFESMIVLTIVFGVIYLLFSVTIRQVWFSSIMVWVILAMTLMTGFVAEPASEPHAVAATPWAVAHGAAMILGAASVLFATASGLLYLLGAHRLKHKEVLRVLGRIPSIEVLGQMNLLGLKVGFVLITLGLVSGLGLISLLGASVWQWLTDGKVVCIIAVWALLAVILALHRFILLKDRARAYLTIVAFVLVLLAVLGVTIVGATRHKFARPLEIPAARSVVT